MMKASSVTLQIPFHDIDSMEVVWHGNYLKYFEIARCALLDSIGYNYPQMKESGYLWPVIDVQMRFVKPLRFGQEILITATLTDWENGLKIKYLVEDKATKERITTGSTTQVAVDMKTGETCFISPDVVFQKLGLPVP